MNNQAKLRVIFNRYNISSKATKNFINYFMSNAKFNAAVNDSVDYRADNINTISNHEDDRYEFVISNCINGKHPSASHEADENFNFNITAELKQFGEFYDGRIIQIYNHGDGCIAIKLFSNQMAISNQKYTFKYVVNKSRWTAEKLAELFPNGLPDGVDPNNLKDFEPLLINEDWCSDEYITPVKKIKDYVTFSGDSFDIEALGDSSTKLELIVSDGIDRIVEDDNVSIVMGSLSNSESGESISVSEISKLQKVDDSYKLTLRYKEEFDTADLFVYTLNNVSNGNYGSVSQKYTSYVSGYNVQIPLQKDGAYKDKSKTLWYAAGDNEHTIGMNFCNLHLGNLDTDKVRIEIERVDSDDMPRANICVYLNNILRARVYGGSQELAKIYEDSAWPATLTYVRFLRDRLEGAKFRMVLFDENENVITDNASFSEIAEIYNYNGSIGHAYLSLDNNETAVFNFEKKADKFIDASRYGGELVMADAKEIANNINTGIHIFNRREWDRDASVLEKSKQDIDIPVNLKIVSLTGEKITDVFPYIEGFTASIAINKPKEKVEYSHKTDTFMITTPNGSEFDIVNAFYKIGFYALDGSNKSSEELAKSFIDKACFTVHYKNIYGTPDYKYGYCLYIKPRPEHVNDDTFYSISSSFVAHDLSSPIIMAAAFGETADYNICKTALLPIIEFSHDKSSYDLRGLMYMDLYNADDNTPIDRDWVSDDNATISVNGEDALDTCTILITKI